MVVRGVGKEVLLVPLIISPVQIHRTIPRFWSGAEPPSLLRSLFLGGSCCSWLDRGKRTHLHRRWMVRRYPLPTINSALKFSGMLTLMPVAALSPQEYVASRLHQPSPVWDAVRAISSHLWWPAGLISLPPCRCCCYSGCRIGIAT